VLGFLKASFKSTNVYLIYCLTFSLYFDLARDFNKDSLTILIIRIDELFSFIPEQYSLLIFFLLLFLLCNIFHTLFLNINKKSYILDSLRQLIICFVSFLVVLYIFKGVWFSYRYIALYFLTLFFIILFIGYFHLKIVSSPIYLIILFITVNTFMMFANWKSDSQLFERVFEDNRIFTAGWTRTLDNSGIDYFALNCCSSENYMESGMKPGAFMNQHNNDLLFVNGKGFFYKIKLSQIGNYFASAKKLNTNFNEFIDIDKFNEVNKLSIRGTLIDKNTLYISFINENKKDCYNLEVLSGEIEQQEIYFSRFFQYDQCNQILDISNSELHSSSGAMSTDEQYLYLAIGEFLSATNSQDINSKFGKILRINKTTKKSDQISMGHRNIQGMILENGFLYSVEHGPRGGDELNIIKINEIKEKSPLNYGWPISSYGEHYDGRTNDEAMPLHKSHKDYGFIEPKLYFTPSIGISDVKLSNEKIIISSMKSGRLYILDKVANGNVFELPYIDIGHRIRDLILIDNKLIMFLEDLSGIAILDL